MSAAAQKKVRCAVYCRKSSEEGLELEFNSLDAQRDAGLSYIQSQKHEGWIVVADRYEDGGYSGGNMERPALKRLLGDIERGQIDCVVVYKVDRLTRALMDFARLVEIFDQYGVTFVSVTQSFNTTTSMGRLTLNVLLSFAQYERELAGERIRDKFAASRKRGLWMGGIPPLGYDVVNRKLLVNEPEADLVRLMFRRFLELGSATRLVEELAVAGYRTKSWVTQDGKQRQGQQIDKGFLYKILNNRLYLGESVHKGVSHPGEHQALIDAITWQRVQTILAENARHRGNVTRAASPAPLKGLLRCAACGSAMTPSHTRRRGRQYRYYLCTSAIKRGHAACPVRSVAADEAETLVLAQVRRLLRTPEVVARTLAAATKTAPAGVPAANDAETVKALARLDTLWDDLYPAEQQRLLHLMVERVSVTTDGFDVHLRTEGLRGIALELQGHTQHQGVAA